MSGCFFLKHGVYIYLGLHALSPGFTGSVYRALYVQWVDVFPRRLMTPTRSYNRCCFTAFPSNRETASITSQKSPMALTLESVVKSGMKPGHKRFWAFWAYRNAFRDIKEAIICVEKNKLPAKKYRNKAKQSHFIIFVILLFTGAKRSAGANWMKLSTWEDFSLLKTPCHNRRALIGNALCTRYVELEDIKSRFLQNDTWTSFPSGCTIAETCI